MNRQQKYLLALCFCLSYVLAYFGSEFVKVPLFWYYPLQQSWLFGATPAPGLMMGWYGKLLFCLLCGLAGTALAAVLLRLSPREVSPQLQGLLELSTMTLVLLTLFHLANTLANRIL